MGQDTRKSTTNSEMRPNTALQTDERRVSVAVYCRVTRAPLAAERQAVMPIGAERSILYNGEQAKPYAND